MKPWTKETPRDYSRDFGPNRVAEVFEIGNVWLWRLQHLNTLRPPAFGDCATAATAKASAMRAAKRLGWL